MTPDIDITLDFDPKFLPLSFYLPSFFIYLFIFERIFFEIFFSLSSDGYLKVGCSFGVASWNEFIKPNDGLLSFSSTKQFKLQTRVSLSSLSNPFTCPCAIYVLWRDQ